MKSQIDLDRLKAEYAERDRRLAGSDIYSVFNTANLFLRQQRQREVLKVLKNNHLINLKGKSVLEVGCGGGGVLNELLFWGADYSTLFGIDILPERVKGAYKQFPVLPLHIADGQYLPFPNDVFDLILQFTVFSSILDAQIKQNMAHEMLRVLRVGGIILWYDFWMNPTNPHTRGIKPVEIRELFPDCKYHFQKITLAPPIARRLISISWMLCGTLEKLKLFNTHYLVTIEKIGSL